MHRIRDVDASQAKLGELSKHYSGEGSLQDLLGVLHEK